MNSHQTFWEIVQEISSNKNYISEKNKNTIVYNLENSFSIAMSEHNKRTEEDCNQDLINVAVRMGCKSTNIDFVKNFLHKRYQS